MTIRKWQLPYVGYVLGHPFDGFYDLKHEKRGSGVTAALLYVLLGLSALCRGRYTEYLFDPSGGKENALWQLVIAVGPYVLWCVANWCFTSLMDGEGGLADMLLATGYALTPQIIANFLVTGLSWILVSEEASILSAVSAIGTIWTVSWVFFAMMITQQYSLGKSAVTAVLTLIGMALILFVLLLLFYLVQQLWTFAGDLAAEIDLRQTV